MSPLFANGFSIKFRITITVMLSLFLLFVDVKLDGFKQVRGVLNSLAAPLQYAANLPHTIFDWTSTSLASRQRLLADNSYLKEQHLLLSEQLQQMAFLQRENSRLRALLKSPIREDIDKMVAEVMSVESNPNSHQVLLNRGSLNGVFEGQPVLDDKGVVGQVVSVGSTTSRVLLISDTTHGIPVRVARNSIRTIATGTGFIERLELNHLPHSTDIRVDDLLVSSGLGGRFPEGYPVAIVRSINSDKSRPFSQVLVEPIAELDRIRYLLLLWPPGDKHKPVYDAMGDLTDKAEALIP
jgi:rod shape-determining protein MreC